MDVDRCVMCGEAPVNNPMVPDGTLALLSSK